MFILVCCEFVFVAKYSRTNLFSLKILNLFCFDAINIGEVVMLKKVLVIFTFAICGFRNVQGDVQQPCSNPTEVISENNQEEALISCVKCGKKHRLDSSSVEEKIIDEETTLAGCPGCKKRRAA